MLQRNTERGEVTPVPPQTPTRLNLLRARRCFGEEMFSRANLRQELQQNGVRVSSAFSILLL